METKGVKIFTIVITLMVIVILIIVFNSEAGQLNASLEYSRGKSTSVPEIKEAFHTEPDESKSLDSSALWHGPNNQHWLPGTVKE